LPTPALPDYPRALASGAGRWQSPAPAAGGARSRPGRGRGPAVTVTMRSGSPHPPQPTEGQLWESQQPGALAERFALVDRSMRPSLRWCPSARRFTDPVAADHANADRESAKPDQAFAIAGLRLGLRVSGAGRGCEALGRLARPLAVCERAGWPPWVKGVGDRRLAGKNVRRWVAEGGAVAWQASSSRA